MHVSHTPFKCLTGRYKTIHAVINYGRIPRGGLTSHAATPSETPKQLSVPLTLWTMFPYRKQYVDRQVVAVISPLVACEAQAGRNERVRVGRHQQCITYDHWCGTSHSHVFTYNGVYIYDLPTVKIEACMCIISQVLRQ